MRLLGFVLMFAGLMLCFKPLSIFAAVIPVLGRIVGAGTGLAALLLALAFSLITIAIAWIVYRPLLAVILFAGAIFTVLLGIKIRSKPGAEKNVQERSNTP